MPPIEQKLFRAEPDDPRRCKADYEKGQCPYLAMEGAENCVMHGGPSQLNVKKEASKRLFRITKWQERINEIADDAQVKSLREEIGILRVVLEEIMNACKDSATLLIYSSRITDTVLKIEKVVASCHRLEASTGLLLDKNTALQLANVIVNIIVKHVPDQDVVELISDEIVTSIASARGVPSSGSPTEAKRING